MDTPKHENDHDGHLPVTRAEFRSMKDAIKRIEHGMFGENPYEGRGIIAEHIEMRKKVAFATRVAWVSFAAACGALWGLVKPKILGP